MTRAACHPEGRKPIVIARSVVGELARPVTKQSHASNEIASAFKESLAMTPGVNGGFVGIRGL